MKDFIGSTIQIGDIVVLIENKYRNFIQGVIVDIHDKKITIQLMTRDGQSLLTTKTTRYPRETIKVSSPIPKDTN